MAKAKTTSRRTKSSGASKAGTSTGAASPSRRRSTRSARSGQSAAKGTKAAAAGQGGRASQSRASGSRAAKTAARSSTSARAGTSSSSSSSAAARSGRAARSRAGAGGGKNVVSGAKKTVAAPAKAQGASARSPATPSRTTRRSAARVARAERTAAPRAEGADRFAPLTEGEQAAALRICTADSRLAGIAQIGRYRVISVEPLPVKRGHPRAESRLARVVIYDYASERCLDACVDLDGEDLFALSSSHSQPPLSPTEEAEAVAIALADERVRRELSLGDDAQAVLHYWSQRPADLAATRRSAAVILGEPGGRPNVVAVVDLMEETVTEVVPAARW